MVFLHEVARGAADRSYGVQVARLAGLPEAVVERAREVLRMLEEGETTGKAARIVDDLPLFFGGSEEGTAGQDRRAPRHAGRGYAR